MLLLLWAPAARADGLAFDGDLRQAAHVLLDLSPAQVDGIAERRAGRGPVELRLTPDQMEALRAATGLEVRFVLAARKEHLVGDCSCGAYNLGVLVGTRLAVIVWTLGDHLGPTDVVELERALVDPQLAVTVADTPSRVRDDGAGGVPEVRRLLARLPSQAFERRIVLRDGWKARRVALAALARLDDLGPGSPDPLASLHALDAVAASPDPADAIAWPERGAQLDVDGVTILLVPGLLEGELGPPARAWVLLEYRGERLVTAAGLTEWGTVGTRYAWPVPSAGGAKK